MDLNHINLPASLIADLYKNHLIEISNPETVQVIPTDTNLKKNIQYLGKNKKGVCLLVSYAHDVYLPEGALNFLTTILQACKLNLGDTAIINCYHQKISFLDMKEQLSFHYLLIFGVAPVQIGLHEIPLFSIATDSDCNIVYSPAAEQLNNSDPESKMLKSKLWVCLKQLFGI